MKLDARTVAGLLAPPAGKADVIHFDDGLPGFGLRLRSGGKRTWVAQYRFNGLTRRITIGNADVVGVDAARKVAKQALAKAMTGDDPAGEREKTKITLRNVVQDYLQSREGKVRPRTMVEVKRYLTSPAYFGPLHALPIEEIKRQHIASRVMHTEGERGTAAAGLARSALSALFSWGMRAGLCDSNPVIGSYAPEAAPSRDRVLSNDEIAAVWRACGPDEFGRIVRLLILTGQRRTEVGGLRWSELDRERGTWVLPAARAKNGRQHTLPLPPPLPPLAWEILDGIPRVAGRDCLFGSHSASGFTAWHKEKRALDARLGESVRPWVLHDLRRSMATGLANLGTQPHVIEAVLNHQSGHKRGVAGVYNRSIYEREVAAAPALWADHVRTLVEGGERKVVPLRANVQSAS